MSTLGGTHRLGKGKMQKTDNPRDLPHSPKAIEIGPLDAIPATERENKDIFVSPRSSEI